MHCRLLKIDICRDRNDDGELAYLVTPTYNRGGVVDDPRFTRLADT